MFLEKKEEAMKNLVVARELIAAMMKDNVECEPDSSKKTSRALIYQIAIELMIEV